VAFTPERETAYLQRMFDGQSQRLHRVVLFAPLLLLLFAALQAAVLQAPLWQLLQTPAFLLGAAGMAGLIWWMRGIRDSVRFAWAGLALQTVFILACAFMTRPGHGSLALVLPFFIATPLVTAPLWARRRTVLLSSSLAFAAGAVALWHAEAGPTVWLAYAVQGGLCLLVAIAMHNSVDQARRGYFQAEEELAERARIDSLTSLLNRRYFLELGEVLIQRLARRPQAFAALFLDLDHFKAVNDDFGHRVGDRLLVAVAQRMQPLSNEGLIVGRLGGEEFALLLPGADATAAERMAERLRAEIAALRIDEARVSASVGIAAWETGESLSDLLHRADLALLEAKRMGRDRAVHWSEALRPARADPVQPRASVSSHY
jgi:diguanylate cyclase (GGDEF)-like protein